jgi:hypothetical protein
LIQLTLFEGTCDTFRNRQGARKLWHGVGRFAEDAEYIQPIVWRKKANHRLAPIAGRPAPRRSAASARADAEAK